MTPALPHIAARLALSADLKARRDYRQEAQAAAAYLARAAFFPAPSRGPLGPLALAAISHFDPAPREVAAHKDS